MTVDDRFDSFFCLSLRWQGDQLTSPLLNFSKMIRTTFTFSTTFRLYFEVALAL